MVHEQLDEQFLRTHGRVADQNACFNMARPATVATTTTTKLRQHKCGGRFRFGTVRHTKEAAPANTTNTCSTRTTRATAAVASTANTQVRAKPWRQLLELGFECRDDRLHVVGSREVILIRFDSGGDREHSVGAMPFERVRLQEKVHCLPDCCRAQIQCDLHLIRRDAVRRQ